MFRIKRPKMRTGVTVQELNATFGKPKPKKQKESSLQRDIKEVLTRSNLCFISRIRNGATFDPKIKRFRSNTAEPGIPDLLGFRKGTGQAIFIEVKYQDKIENRKRLVCKVRITEDQKVYLKRAHENGCLAGIAFTIDDALAIVHNDPGLYPRHPRTYGFMSDEWLEAYAVEYKEQKRIVSLEKQDPVLNLLKYQR